MINKENIILILAIVITIISICFADYYKKDSIEKQKRIDYYESILNTYTSKKDSLEIIIAHNDSIIKKTKIEIDNDKEYIKSLNDSSLVDTFYKLVWNRDSNTFSTGGMRQSNTSSYWNY